MSYTDNEMCTILLSSAVGLKADAECKPLTLGEWNKFIGILMDNHLEPSIAYSEKVTQLKKFGYDDAFLERIKKLADRGGSVAFELEEYEKRGIKVVTFLNKEYPALLRKKLKEKKPPVLFYAGNLSLASKVGIGVVGSRNISAEGVEFTDRLVKKASEEKLVAFSGGARGVDEVSQNAAMKYNGAAVAYIADALFAKIKDKEVIKNLADGKLVLFSDVKPDVGFSAGRAMNRNKYIYASAMGTFVVESDYKKGGTWAGATEAIKKGWGNVFVWNCGKEGNIRLVEAGGKSFKLTDQTILLDVVSGGSSDGGDSSGGMGTGEFAANTGNRVDVDRLAGNGRGGDTPGGMGETGYRQMTIMDILKPE